MASLAARDLEQIEVFLRGLYRSRRVQPLIWHVLTELPKLVGTNQTTWNVVVPAMQQADVVAWPEQADHDTYQAALARHVHEHPLIVHFLQTGNPEALKLTDFLSPTQLHNTALYDELYRGLGYEDQFAMNLQPLGPQWVSLVVARDTPTFTERDRAVLNLIRPHIAQAYRQARVQSRLARRLDGQRAAPAVTRIVIDQRDAAIHYPARAQRWMEWYFDRLPNVPRRLPPAVQQWLLQVRSALAGESIQQAAAPLVVRRFGRQLIVRLTPHDNAGHMCLELEERTDPHAVVQAAGLRLTPREMQVLLEVEKGKRNREIAAELGMGPLTVKKHLERVFNKLHVDNRTAAVARLRQICGRRL